MWFFDLSGRVRLRLMQLLRKVAANLLFFFRIRHGVMGDHVAKHVNLCLRRGLFGVAPVDRRAGSSAMIGHDSSLPFRFNFHFGFELILVPYGGIVNAHPIKLSFLPMNALIQRVKRTKDMLHVFFLGHLYLYDCEYRSAHDRKRSAQPLLSPHKHVITEDRMIRTSEINDHLFQITLG